MPKSRFVDDEREDVNPDDVRVGALFTREGTLGGLMLVLTARELDALKSGLLVHHAAPSCSDVDLAQPVPIVMCTRESMVRARQLIETVCAMLTADDETRH